MLSKETLSKTQDSQGILSSIGGSQDFDDSLN